MQDARIREHSATRLREAVLPLELYVFTVRWKRHGSTTACLCAAKTKRGHGDMIMYSSNSSVNRALELTHITVVSWYVWPALLIYKRSDAFTLAHTRAAVVHLKLRAVVPYRTAEYVTNNILRRTWYTSTGL